METPLNHITSERDFNQVFDRYFTALLYFAEKIIHSQFDANDMVMLAFESLWEKRDGFTSEEKIKAFLYIAVKNRCRNYLRLRRTFAEVPDEIAEEKRLDNMIMEADLIRNVYNNIAKLPPRTKEVMIYTAQGYTSGEIGKHLGITGSTVTTYRQRAMQLLKQKT